HTQAVQPRPCPRIALQASVGRDPPLAGTIAQPRPAQPQLAISQRHAPTLRAVPAYFSRGTSRRLRTRPLLGRGKQQALQNFSVHFPENVFELRPRLGHQRQDRKYQLASVGEHFLHRALDGAPIVPGHHAQRARPLLRATFHLAVSPVESFLVGKPDSLGFTGETATFQPSTTFGTPPFSDL